jgi:hypothetical protein
MASKLRVDHIEPVGGVPTGGGGGVIQVVSTTKTDTAANNTSAATVWKTGLSATITPKSATSKILMLGFASVCVAGPQFNIGLTLYKDSSILTGATGDASSNRARVHSSGDANTDGASGEQTMVCLPINYMDTAGDTSQRTYYVGIRNPSSITRWIHLNYSITDTDNTYYLRQVSTLTLMEISA